MIVIINKQKQVAAGLGKRSKTAQLIKKSQLNKVIMNGTYNERRNAWQLSWQDFRITPYTLKVIDNKTETRLHLASNDNHVGVLVIKYKLDIDMKPEDQLLTYKDIEFIPIRQKYLAETQSNLILNDHLILKEIERQKDFYCKITNDNL